MALTVLKSHIETDNDSIAYKNNRDFNNNPLIVWEIASLLHLRVTVINSYLARMRRKLGCIDNEALTYYTVHEGLLK
jgi:hypothetical protein